MTLPPALELRDIGFSYDGQDVLTDVNCIISRGEYVGIVGPNGGGKTTLLKILLGLLSPSSGAVSLLGTTPLSARRQGKIGYVPQRIVQSDFLFPASAEEIVRSGRNRSAGLLRPLSRADKEIAEHAMQTAGVSHLKHRLVGTLSGGERQKVFIARALASQPELLILDEPTTGVDAASQEEFYALLRRLHTQERMTILFVSHDIEVMAKEASTILCLNRTLVAHCHACDFMHTAQAQELYGASVKHIHHHHAH